MTGVDIACDPVSRGVRFEDAIAWQQRGDARRADAVCRELLQAQPDHADAWHLRGLLAFQEGRLAQGIELVEKSLALNAHQPAAYANIGAALLELHRPFEAVAHFERAVALQPDSPLTLCGLGRALASLQRSSEALGAFDAALRLAPDLVPALNGRAQALHDLSRLEEALICLSRALALAPTDADALFSRGNVLYDLERYPEALASYDRALSCGNVSAQVLNNRGNALRALSRADEALGSYRQALALEPGLAETLSNCGNALLDLNRLEEAMSQYQAALRARPDYAEALNNLGNALLALNRPSEALAWFDRALALKPDLSDAYNNRGAALVLEQQPAAAAQAYAELLKISPDYPFALGALLYARAQSCDWQEDSILRTRLEAAVLRGYPVAHPWTFLTLCGSAELQQQCAQIFVAHHWEASEADGWRGGPYPHEKIRIAYLSADFHEHATAVLAAGLFEVHDRERFEVIGVCYGRDDASPMRRRLQAGFDRFLEVRQLGDPEVVHLLRSLEIDIAVDLKGYTVYHRAGILARRAAPIQVSYLAYPGTMALPSMDYILADPITLPAEHRVHYTERVVYLPECYQVNDDRRAIAEPTPSRAEVGLPAQGFVFCCFNNPYKINRAMFEIWMRLLQGLPGSVLWLLADNPGAVNNLRRAAVRLGVDPDRLVFAPRVPAPEHLARQRLADLFLDTLPCNAHTTCSDALWAGLPVLTCLGEGFAGRVSASLLQAASLPELVTRSLEDYATRASELACMPAQLSELRSRLLRNRASCSLFSTARFCRHLESAYSIMWRRHQEGLPPEDFAVPQLSPPVLV